MRSADTNKLDSDSWLRNVVFCVVYSWMRWVSLDGWAFLYYHDSEVTNARQCWHELLHVFLAPFSVFVFILLYWPTWNSCHSLAFGLAIFKCVDLFFHFSMLAIFGNAYGYPWLETMSPKRMQRTLIVALLMLIELVFWHATLAYLFERHWPGLFCEPISLPAHALQYSMSTATTVGYGTYAPVHWMSVTHALFESVSALLLLAGLAASVFSYLAGNGNQAVKKQNRRYDEQRKELLIRRAGARWEVGRGWCVRWILPILAPALIVWLAGFTFAWCFDLPGTKELTTAVVGSTVVLLCISACSKNHECNCKL